MISAYGKTLTAEVRPAPRKPAVCAGGAAPLRRVRGAARSRRPGAGRAARGSPGSVRIRTREATETLADKLQFARYTFSSGEDWIFGAGAIGAATALPVKASARALSTVQPSDSFEPRPRRCATIAASAAGGTIVGASAAGEGADPSPPSAASRRRAVAGRALAARVRQRVRCYPAPCGHDGPHVPSAAAAASRVPTRPPHRSRLP